MTAIKSSDGTLLTGSCEKYYGSTKIPGATKLPEGVYRKEFELPPEEFSALVKLFQDAVGQVYDDFVVGELPTQSPGTRRGVVVFQDELAAGERPLDEAFAVGAALAYGDEQGTVLVVNDSRDSLPEVRRELATIDKGKLAAAFGGLFLGPLAPVILKPTAEWARSKRAELGVPYTWDLPRPLAPARVAHDPAQVRRLEAQRHYLAENDLELALDARATSVITTLAYALRGSDALGQPFDLQHELDLLRPQASKQAELLVYLHRKLMRDPRSEQVRSLLLPQLECWRSIMLVQAVQATGMFGAPGGPVEALERGDAEQIFRRLAGEADTAALSEGGQAAWLALQTPPEAHARLVAEVERRRDVGPGLLLQDLLRQLVPGEVAVKNL